MTFRHLAVATAFTLAVAAPAAAQTTAATNAQQDRADADIGGNAAQRGPHP